MPIATSVSNGTVQLSFSPSVSSARDDWNAAAATWVSRLLRTNAPDCPFDEKAQNDLCDLLLGISSRLMKFVSTPANYNNVLIISFIFPDKKVWDLQIDAFVGRNASTTYYRILDLRVKPIMVGVDNDGNLNTIVIARRNLPPPPQSIATTIPTVSPQHVATLVDSTNAGLDAAGENVAAALDRLQRAASSASLSRAVGRTQAALDMLVRVGAKAR